MKAEPVDPRDIRWESDQPTYRVYFWGRQSQRPFPGWASEEWRLGEVDVADVLVWAKERGQGRYITIWVEHESKQLGLGMIRLLGWEPTRSDSAPPWTA